MSDHEKLRSLDAEVLHFIKWAIVTNKKYKKFAMSIGGVNELIQEICVDICKDNTEFSCKWTTACFNKVRWTIARRVSQKKRQIKMKQLESDFVDYREQAPFAEVDQLDLRKKLNTVLHKEINVLPAHWAKSVKMRLDGMTYREIARKSKRTIEQCRQRMLKGCFALWKIPELRELATHYFGEVYYDTDWCSWTLTLDHDRMHANSRRI